MTVARYRLAVLASALSLGACDHPVTTSETSSLHHRAFLGHAVTCNATPFVDVMPPRTELGSALDCLGWQEWADARDLHLDVVRYGTIVELAPLERIAELDGRMAEAYITHAITAKVGPVLKGVAPTGTFEITVPIGIGADPAHRIRRGLLHPVDENETRLRGGYANLVFDDVAGLLFVPTDRVDSPPFLGCLGGHFAKPDAFRPKLIEDYRKLTDLMNRRSLGSLASETPDSPLLTTLVASGGSTVGYFVAEYFGWQTATVLLERSMKQAQTTPFELGLVEGAIRMQALRRLSQYAAPAWQNLDDTALAARLFDWAILRIPDMPAKKNRMARDEMSDRQRRVAAWIVSNEHAMAPELTRFDLTSTDRAIDQAVALISTLKQKGGAVGGYSADLEAFERVMAGQPPTRAPAPPYWFHAIGACLSESGEVVSRTPAHDWLRLAFGPDAVDRWR